MKPFYEYRLEYVASEGVPVNHCVIVISNYGEHPQSAATSITSSYRWSKEADVLHTEMRDWIETNCGYTPPVLGDRKRCVIVLKSLDDVLLFKLRFG